MALILRIDDTIFLELWLIKGEKQWQTTLVNKPQKNKTKNKKLQKMSEEI